MGATTRERALGVVRRAGGTVTAAEARAAGVRWEDLYALRDEHALVELSRGVYRLREAEANPFVDLVAVCRRVPQGTICLASALAFWDLTDQIPAEVHVAVARGRWPPRIAYPPTRVHVFQAETFALDRRRVELGSGESISVYSPERTVVDMMRMRSRVGSDLTIEALKRYLKGPGASPARLLELGEALRVRGPLASALAVLLG